MESFPTSNFSPLVYLHGFCLDVFHLPSRFCPCWRHARVPGPVQIVFFLRLNFSPLPPLFTVHFGFFFGKVPVPQFPRACFSPPEGDYSSRVVSLFFALTSLCQRHLRNFLLPVPLTLFFFPLDMHPPPPLDLKMNGPKNFTCTEYCFFSPSLFPLLALGLNFFPRQGFQRISLNQSISKPRGLCRICLALFRF